MTPHVQVGYRFATVPEWVVFHPQLSALQVRIYAVLDRHGRDPESCFPSHARIAQLCQVSERSIGRPIAQMEQLGVLQVVPRSRRGRRVSNGYRLAGDAPLTAHTSAVELPTARAPQRGPERAPQRGEREPLNEMTNQVVSDTQDGAAAARAALQPPTTGAS